MALHVYNTLTRQKELFEPLNEGRVNIYVCGPTVYGHAHIGHAKSYISFDTIIRYLRYAGYTVKYVQNITDVGHLTDNADDGDDKIAAQARKEKLDPMQVAQYYTWSYFDDMEALGVERPDISPHATGHITEQIEVIENLISNGHAYESNGSVYFDIMSFKEYGKLSGRKVDELEAGARIDVHPDKKHPGDFALWKHADPEHLMKWPSPWGLGYPGWHVECSAMAMKYLGETFDIHGGGVDNIFPHHECEIAQSEAATGKPFARYWLHNNMVSVNDEKMGKSKGNFVTVKDMLEKYSQHTIRYFVLSSHYRSRLEYSEEAVRAAEQGLSRLISSLGHLEEAIVQASEVDGFEPPFDLEQYSGRFNEAMDDDFNAPRAIAVLFDMSKATNQYLASGSALHAPFLQSVRELVHTLGHNVLGILPAEIESGKAEVDSELLEGLVQLNLDIRNNLRKEKLWALSDQIRDELKRLNIILEDRPDGSTDWKLDN